MNRRVSALLLLVLLLASLLAQSQTPAAAPDVSQEAFVFEHLNEVVRFENDGSGTRDVKAVVRIQSQAGVRAFGQLVFGYSTANEDLKIDYVRVRTADGKVIETPASTTQDFAPEVLREAPMYSDYRERHISVADLRPSVTLEYHTVTAVKPLAPGEFWYEHNFIRHAALLDSTLEINVPDAREVKLKSPDRKYETRKEGDRRIYLWTVKDFVPARGKRGESDSEDEDDSDWADVQLSSFTDWQQISNWYAKLQSDRATPDQSIKEKSAELTRGLNTQEEKARRLYDFVAQNIRYVSLSFGVGRLQPHAASEVLQNGYGDCKDKHTLLQALLAAQGIRSYPVLINAFHKIDADVPSPAQFNHLITVAKIGDTATWLDATAEVAPYGLISYSLRNKQAVVAATDSFGGLKRTPVESPVKSGAALTVNAKVSELGAMDANVEVAMTGDSDWPIRAAFREVSPADWPRALQFFSQQWGLPGDVTEVHIEKLEDTAKPLRITYHVHKADFFKVPSSATNFQLLPPSRFGRIAKASKKRPGEPLDVGPAGEDVTRAHVEFPANFTIHVPADVSITRDYGQYNTSYKFAKNVLDAERRMVLKVNELPSSRRADYSSFHNVTTSAVEETPWCSIARPSAASLAAAAEMKGTPRELREAGNAALNRQDFATAAALLQRAADQDSNSREGWENLGQAYGALSQHDKAAQAFQKLLEKDPANAHANAELAAELVQLGRFDDAIAAYKKQIELSPSEKLGHKQLGLLLVQMKRDPEAQTELEAAAAIPPDDPEVKMALAKLYSRTGESKKAEVIMASLIGGVAGSTTNDFFAPALREDVDPEQTAHDAEKNLSGIGDQFDSGEYDRLDANSYTAMDMVALSWARLGWARFLQGDNLVASQFLEAAWQLSHSGTVANRLARVYEKTGARDRAVHMYALAAAAGGAATQNSREQVVKLNSAAAGAQLLAAKVELEKMQTLPLPVLVSGTVSARVALLFDNSTSPDRVQFLDGDEALRAAVNRLQTTEFPVKFPDVSSIKIIRLAKVSCANSSCTLSMVPLSSMQTSNDQRPAPIASKPPAVMSTPQVGITAPHLVTAPDPDYPDGARRAKIQGKVLVQCEVGTDGTVRNARILTSLRKDLDASAIDAVSKWRFEPAIKDGKPVVVQINVEVNFNLYKDQAGDWRTTKENGPQD
jgi:TonB family protein